MTHTLKIRRAYALLTGRNTHRRRRNLAGKILFHRCHAGIDKQQRLVPVRNERKALEPQMTLRLKE